MHIRTAIEEHIKCSEQIQVLTNEIAPLVNSRIKIEARKYKLATLIDAFRDLCEHKFIDDQIKGGRWIICTNCDKSYQHSSGGTGTGTIHR